MSRQIDKSQIIDYDEIYASATAATNATTTILTLQLKPGKQPVLLFVGNAIAAGGEPYVTFQLQVNRAPYYPFDGSLNQWAPPESNYDLTVPYLLSTSSEVRVVAINSDTVNTYAATARVKIGYIDFPSNPYQ